ncbi:MAG: LuxR C-terminal-related transcriptional regulator [Desulfatiglandales bacterium]
MAAMNDFSINDNHSREHPEGVKIYIIGPRTLENALLASFLEQETGMKSMAVESTRDLPAEDVKGLGGESVLLLLDCMGKDADTCIGDLEAGDIDIVSQCPAGIFNADPGVGCEEAFVMEGFRGIFYVHDNPEHVLKGIAAILSGELWLSRGVMSRCLLSNSARLKKEQRHNGVLLTGREREILRMLTVGSTNEEIAADLCISHHTVKTHIYNIFKKIDVPNRLQAALWAARYLTR